MRHAAAWLLMWLTGLLALSGSGAFDTEAGHPLAPGSAGASSPGAAAPKVVDHYPTGQGASTTEPVVLVFDRPLDANARVPVRVEPPVPLEPVRYGERALVLRHPPFRRGARYRLALDAPSIAFRASFRTADPATVTAYGPQGKRAHPAATIRVTFSEAVDRRAVEAAFRLEPAAPGSFEWPDERTMVWRPGRLRSAETYDVRAGGAAADGSPIWPARWRFRTTAPAPALRPGSGKRMILTFDDDPLTPERGYRLLDLLARHRVRAILFPTGAWADLNPAFIRLARAGGQLVCNHTRDHADLASLTTAEMREQILYGADADRCDLLRAPYGRSNQRVEAVANALGYRLFWWNIDSGDWRGRSAAAIASEVLRNARPGGVALFHMQAPHTLEALPAIVWGLRAAGYELSY